MSSPRILISPASGRMMSMIIRIIVVLPPPRIRGLAGGGSRMIRGNRKDSCPSVFGGLYAADRQRFDTSATCAWPDDPTRAIRETPSRLQEAVGTSKRCEKAQIAMRGRRQMDRRNNSPQLWYVPLRDRIIGSRQFEEVHHALSRDRAMGSHPRPCRLSPSRSGSCQSERPRHQGGRPVLSV